ncbi:precorrin-2 dehydrogenase/sirohydrochlorin ferrochelatase family protein [Taklimakanibacter lacteus]|uniref:precorrin-2 dehydrogenase/sirohydrochlorin ferrochelatase family protein n=1 Tax=Taklimakanibacter lacteus TaxID=2268456 RepID=UPI0013C4E92E
MKPLAHLPSHPANRIAALKVLPVFFDLDGKRAVVIGGSAAAAWKAELLAAAGAQVEIYATKAGEEMLTLVSNGAAQGSLTLTPSSWTAQSFAEAALIVADVPPAEAAELRKAARMAGVPINLVDRPEFCDFQFGSIVNRSPMVIGISTGGAAPVLAQMVRSRIESILPSYLASWAAIAQRIRYKVSQTFATAQERRRYWEGFAVRAMQAPPGPVDGVEPGTERAEEQVTTIEVDRADDLTLRQIRALQSADVIHVNGRCPPGLLDFARREAKRITHRAGARKVQGEGSGNIVIIRS